MDRIDEAFAGEAYMMRPSEVFKLYLGPHLMDTQFQYGMLAMGLEMVTIIKTLQALPTTSVAAKEETISVLHTLLQDLGLDVYAYEWYERLNEWRKPRFVLATMSDPSQLDELVPSPADIVGAVVPILPELPALASQLASTPPEELGLPDTDAQPGSDQTMDQPSISTDESPSEEGPTTPSE